MNKIKKEASKKLQGMIVPVEVVHHYIDKTALAERERCVDKIKEWPRWSPESDEELDKLADIILNQQDDE